MHAHGTCCGTDALEEEAELVARVVLQVVRLAELGVLVGHAQREGAPAGHGSGDMEGMGQGVSWRAGSGGMVGDRPELPGSAWGLQTGVRGGCWGCSRVERGQGRLLGIGRSA